MLESKIKQAVLDQGFHLVGISTADDPLLQEAVERYSTWVDAGRGATMDYLKRHADLKANPCKLLPDCRSIISVAMLYGTEAVTEDARRAQVSLYTRGDDYHELMSRKLELLADWLKREHQITARAFVDSQPVLERFWAWRAGLGWVGKNAVLINRKAGSYLFLGGLLVDAALSPDAPTPDHCGRCTKCIEACPTEAIVEDRTVDSGRCIAYHTIENRGIVPEAVMAKTGRWIAGCDICQAVCPWNDPVTPGPEFATTNRTFNAPLGELAQWAAEDFKAATKTTAMGRMKFSGFVRNVTIAVANSGLSRDEKGEALERLEKSAGALAEGPGRDGASAAVQWAKRSIFTRVGG